MPRPESAHDFRPGRLLAGLVLLTAAVLYLGDAGGWWGVPWYLVFPLVCGGLLLSAAVAGLGFGLRHRANRGPGPGSSDTGEPG